MDFSDLYQLFKSKVFIGVVETHMEEHKHTKSEFCLIFALLYLCIVASKYSIHLIYEGNLMT